MKIENYEFPKSSFLSIQKDLELITAKILKNERLKRLLFYTTPDALERPRISEAESFNLFKQNIKIIPKFEIDGSVLNYLVIGFDNFVPNAENPEFRDNIVSFEIVCHIDQWDLKNFKLRPYLIAAEIDSMLNGKHLTGIGNLEFLSANQVVLNDEYAGVSLLYMAIHGEEDKVGMLNPLDDIKFAQEFHEMRKQ